MRVPFSKVYRAFPELDRFSDAECEKFVSYVRARGGAVHRLLVLGAAVLGLAVWIGLMVVFALGLRAFVGPSRQPPVAAIVLSIVMMVGVAASPFMSGLLVRDWLLVRGIRSRLRFLACTQCGYSLLGLTTADGVVNCPECGKRVRLSDLGVRPEEMLAGVLVGRETPYFDAGGLGRGAG